MTDATAAVSPQRSSLAASFPIPSMRRARRASRRQPWGMLSGILDEPGGDRSSDLDDWTNARAR